MTEQELNILIHQTLDYIYKVSYKNKIEGVQADYFINSLIYHLGLAQRNDSYKRMVEASNMGEQHNG